jgi:hypothetical protein
MGDFFHNAFQNRYLGSFWFFENWVRFAKSMLVTLLRPAGFGGQARGSKTEGGHKRFCLEIAPIVSNYLELLSK